MTEKGFIRDLTGVKIVLYSFRIGRNFQVEFTEEDIICKGVKSVDVMRRLRSRT